jgi:hypothetical protein
MTGWTILTSTKDHTNAGRRTNKRKVRYISASSFRGSQSNFDNSWHSNGAFLVPTIFTAHFVHVENKKQSLLSGFSTGDSTNFAAFLSAECWNLRRRYRNSCRGGPRSCLRWHLRSCGHGWDPGVGDLAVMLLTVPLLSMDSVASFDALISSTNILAAVLFYVVCFSSWSGVV